MSNAADAALNQALKALSHDPAQAETLCRGLLAADAGHGDAKLVLSEALRRQGKLAEARDLVAPLAAQHKQWFGAQRQLGIILADEGEALAASLALRQAAEAAPQHPTIWRDLGDQLGLAGDAKGAEDAYARHSETPAPEPKLAQIAHMLARGEADAAERDLRAHLQAFPNDVVALRLVSEAQARGERPDEAEASLRKCLKLAPGFLYARHALAQLLMGLGRNEEARAQADDLLRRDPNNKGSLRVMAAILGNLGEYEAALELYERLLNMDSGQPRVWMSYGHTLKTLGRTEDGIGAYKKSIALMPQLGESYWSLANLKTFRFEDAELAEMRNMAERLDTPESEKVGFYYAIGKALEDRGEAEAAFENYAKGAKLYRATIDYDPERLSQFADESRALFTPEFFSERDGAGCEADDAIFVVGLPRAGSTLIEQILASHSQVEGTMELPDLQNLAHGLIEPAQMRAGESYLGALAKLDNAQLRALGERYLDSTKVQRKLGRPFFINKLPNNFLHIGFIRLILPNAKIVDARRHPMACGWSCFKQHFANGQFFSYDLGDIGRYYADYVRLMAHYDAALPGYVHRVIHEQLAHEPEPQIRALLAFCGLAFEEQCLRPHETERAVRTASSEQVRQPISARGLDSWKPFEPFLGDLKQALGPALPAYPDAPG